MDHPGLPEAHLCARGGQHPRGFTVPAATSTVYTSTHMIIPKVGSTSAICPKVWSVVPFGSLPAAVGKNGVWSKVSATVAAMLRSRSLALRAFPFRIFRNKNGKFFCLNACRFQNKSYPSVALLKSQYISGFREFGSRLFFAFSISNNVPKIRFHLSSHFCAHFLRIPSLCHVRPDTNLVLPPH